MKKRKLIKNILILMPLIVVSLTTLFPFVWMITTSLKDNREAMAIPIQLLPSQLNFEAYQQIWEVIPLLSSVKNTILIVVPILTIGTFCSAIAAFAFAKMDFPCKNAIFILVLSTMMFPGIITLIPQYVAWGELGLTNSLVPLIVPGLFGNASMMFFMKQSLLGIPDDYIHAAQIDGAGWFRVFFNVFLPFMKPAIVTQVIINFRYLWNDFMGPLVYLDSEKKFTVQLVLRLLSDTGRTGNQYPLMMAGAALSCVPLLLLFIFFQRYFVDSMVASGVKG